MTRGDLLQLLIVLADNSLRLRTNHRRYARRAGYVGQVGNDNLSARVFAQFCKYLVEVSCKLVNADPVTDVVNANADRYQIRIRAHCRSQLGTDDVGRRGATNAEIDKLRLRSHRLEPLR